MPSSTSAARPSTEPRRRRLAVLLLAVLVVACSDAPEADAGDPDTGPVDDTGTEPEVDAPLVEDTAPDLDDPCAGAYLPTQISTLPFVEQGSTLGAGARTCFEAYSCAPDIDESGPEQRYSIEIEVPGTLIVGVESSGDADIDVHVLSTLLPEACVARGHIGASTHVEPGTWFIVADSWVDAEGTAKSGDYTLHVHFLPDDGPCGMVSEALGRIGTDDLLAMPATGPIVKEAHLVTAEEIDSFADGWPAAIDDGIEAHYAASEAASGYAMTRTEPWAPCCEPSNEFGQGSSVPPPLEAEAWYVNMRWNRAPARGERYLVFDPISGRAVVGAAGYENGPGDLSRVGGASEEIHDHLGSGHLEHLTFGKATDQSLPYGPIDCTAAP